MIQIEDFKIIGIATETINEDGKSAEDLGKLWERFFAEDIPARISNKASDKVYTIYTDYKTDFRGAYTSIIGFKVTSLDHIPNGFTGREFKGGKYQKLVAKGAMPNAVMEKWQEIWGKDSELNRSFTVDFEVYGRDSQKGEDSEVEIYIAVE